MSNYNFVLEALRNGASQESIANEFAAALNKAAAEYKAETQKKENDTKKKLAAAQSVVDFYSEYYPNFFKGMTAEELIAICETIDRTSVKMSKSAAKNPLVSHFNI